MTKVAALIRSIDAILFDFDGPVCSVFAGYPAPSVAQALRDVLTKEQVRLPACVVNERDPLNILRWASGRHPSITTRLEEVLCAAEEEAVRSAAPTKHAHEAIIAATRSGRSVAIVSNNSATAIRSYLALHGLTPHVRVVVGRPFANPGLMKPNPRGVLDALHALETRPAIAMLVGDSPSDVEAACRAGVAVVGYAKSVLHKSALEHAGAEIVIDRMGDLVDALDETSRKRSQA